MNRIGKYEIQDEIGRGGFGKVYRAYDPQVRRLVAIKVLTGDSDPNAVGRFRVEATAAGNLLHKNIVTVYEFAQDAGVQFLVMEYLEGEDLQHIIASGRPLSMIRKLRIMYDVADGLLCAHRHGVVHRDVKPANIMLLSDGNVKIMDFGIARLTGEDATRMTKPGFIMGSLTYMSPEQFQSGQVDELCDVWSYGCVLYELLAGVSPFHAPDPPSVMFKVSSHTPPPISSLIEDCPKDLDPILLRLLSRDREARYQTFEDVQFDLDSVLLALQRQEAATLFLQAKKFRATNELEKAEGLIGQVLDFDRGNTEVRQFREQLRGQIRALRLTRPKVEALTAKAGEAFAQGNYSEACEFASAALKLDSTCLPARELLSEAQQANDRRERAARLLNEAERLLRNSELTAAFEKVREAQQTEPANPRASDLLAGIQSEIDARERSRRIRDALGKARGLIVTGAVDDAIRMLTEVSSTYPESPEVSALLARTVRERDEQQSRQRLDARIAEIRELLRAGRLVAAIAELEELKQAFPAETEIESMLSYARDALEEQRRKDAVDRIGREAWALARAKKFDESLAVLTRALREHPADERLTRLMQKIVSVKTQEEEEGEVAVSLDRCEKLRQTGSFIEAGRILNGLLSRYPHNDRIAASRTALQKSIDEDEARKRAETLDRQVADAREALQRGQADRAVQLLEEISRADPSRPDVAAHLEAARKAKREQQEGLEIQAILKAVADREAAGDLAAARELLGPAHLRYPGSVDLLNAIQRLDAEIVESYRRKALATVTQAIEDGLRHRDWPLCFSRLADADRQFPGEAGLWDLRSRVNREQREDEDRRRKDAVGALVKEIEDGIGRQDWPFCRTRLDQADKEYPDEPQLRNLRSRAVSEQKRQEEAGRAQSLAAATKAIEDGVRRRDWAFCEARLSEADREYPGDPSLAKLRAAFTVERQKDEAESRRRESLEAITRAVEERMARRDWESCLSKLTDADKQFPGESSLRALREKLTRAQFQDEENERRIQTLAEMSEAIEAGIARQDWAACQERLIKAEKQFPGEPSIPVLREKVNREQLLDEAERRRRQSLTAAVNAIEEGIRLRDWPFCDTRLTEAERQFPDQPQLRSLRTKIVTEKRRDEAERLRLDALGTAVREIEDGMARRDWQFCFVKLQEADRKFPAEPALRSVRARVSGERQRDEEESHLRAITDIGAAIQDGIRLRDWAFCDQRLGEAERQYPGEPALRTLRTKVNFERHREEEDRRLQALAAITSAVEDAIRRKDWEACQRQLAEADKQYPGEPAIGELRQRVAAGQQRAVDERRIAALGTIVKAIEEGIARRDWPFCLARLTDADKQYAGDASLRSVRARVEHERESDEAERRLREAEDLCVRASESIVREEWARATDLINAGLHRLPEHAMLLKLRDQLKAARDRRQAISAAEAELSRQRLNEAEAMVRALLKKQPGDPEAITLLASVQQHKERQENQKQRAAGRDQLDQLLRNREYEKAIRRATALLDAFPGDSGFEESLKSAIAAKELHERRIQLGDAIAKIERLFQKGKAEEVRNEAAAILSIQEEARARELYEWAEATIKRQRETADRPLPGLAAKEPSRRPKRGLIVSAVLALALIAGLGLVIYSRKPSVPIGRIAPASLAFVQSGSTAPGSQSIKVAGDGSEFAVSVSDDWIRVRPLTAKSPATLVVDVDAAPLKEGHHSGYVTILGPNGISRTVPIGLSLERNSPPKQVEEAKTPPPDKRPIPKPPPDVRHKVEPAKTEPTKTEPPPIKAVIKPLPPPSPCAPSGSELQVTPSDVYTGPISGKGFWTGNLPATCTVVLAAGRAGFGTLSKPLPSTDATVTLSTQGVEIVDRGVGRVAIRNSSGQTITRVDFSWRVNSR